MSEYPTKLLEARYTEHFCLEMIRAWTTEAAEGDYCWSLLQLAYWRDHLKGAVAWRQNAEALDG